MIFKLSLIIVLLSWTDGCFIGSNNTSAPHGNEASTSTKGCIYHGVTSHPGDKVQQNCNECLCELKAGGSPGESRFSCQTNACLLQEDIMKKINEGRYSWTARNYTEFWGKTLDFGNRSRLGTLFPETSVQNMNEIFIVTSELPESFDARQRWPGFIQDVRDQANCGSSWAFSTTATSADRLAIMTQGKVKVHLAPQQLLSCNQRLQHGCEGGYLDRAWWYIRKLGVVSEECYPYKSGQTNDPGVCLIRKEHYFRPQGIKCPAETSNNRTYKMTPPYRVSDKEQEIMTEIMKNGPVQATFLVHEDFYMYSGGVYRHSELAKAKGQNYTAEGYHSVRILGWGVDRAHDVSEKFWLCANSWGPQWGEAGLFRIVRGENHCGIESFIIGALGSGQVNTNTKRVFHGVVKKD